MCELQNYFQLQILSMSVSLSLIHTPHSEGKGCHQGEMPVTLYSAGGLTSEQ